MTPALIAQINAIARVCVTEEISNHELLAVLANRRPSVGVTT
jgi:hypothetical protein